MHGADDDIADRHGGRSPGIAELRRDLFSLAAGWVWNPLDKTHGPQVTFGVGPMFVRFTHELDLGTQLHVGFWLKGYSAWAWSR